MKTYKILNTNKLDLSNDDIIIFEKFDKLSEKYNDLFDKKSINDKKQNIVIIYIFDIMKVIINYILKEYIIDINI
jgi:hypothetical protein